MNSRTPIVINTDMMASGDDANALVLLLQSGRVEVVGVMAENGNVNCYDSYANVSKLLRDLGFHKDVSIGQPRWVMDNVEKLRRIDGYFHGAFKSRNIDQMQQEFTSMEPADMMLCRLARQYGEELCIVNIAPATNIAAALALMPDLGTVIHNVYFMGGAFDVPGNASPWAEFNIWFDPQSADRVFKSDWNITLLPLDATNGHSIPQDFYVRQGLPHNFREIRADSSAWDELLAGILLNPSIEEGRRNCSIKVDTSSGDTAGRTSILKESGNTSIVYRIKTNWLDLLLNHKH